MPASLRRDRPITSERSRRGSLSRRGTVPLRSELVDILLDVAMASTIIDFKQCLHGRDVRPEQILHLYSSCFCCPSTTDGWRERVCGQVERRYRILHTKEVNMTLLMLSDSYGSGGQQKKDSAGHLLTAASMLGNILSRRALTSSKERCETYSLTSSNTDNLSKYCSKKSPSWITRDVMPLLSGSAPGLRLQSLEVASKRAKAKFFLYVSGFLVLMAKKS